MNYTVKKTDNYKVLLKPNEFYETDTLESGNYYPSMAVKNYIINFGYNFKADKKTDLEYSYNVTVDLVGICSSSEGQYKEIWTRKFDVLETKTENVNSDKFTINQEVYIDYEYYYNLVSSYEETYGVQLNTILKVKFNMNFPNLNGKEMKDYIEVDINLNELVTNAEENYQTVKSNIISKPTTNSKSESIINISICILFLILVIFGIYKIRNRNPKDKYKHKVKNILKYCKDLIITVKIKPDFGNLKIIKIDDLNSLVNLAEQTKSNIIYYEAVKDRKSDFYVISNKFIYVFEVKA